MKTKELTIRSLSGKTVSNVSESAVEQKEMYLQ